MSKALLSCGGWMQAARLWRRQDTLLIRLLSTRLLVRTVRDHPPTRSLASSPFNWYSHQRLRALATRNTGALVKRYSQQPLPREDVIENVNNEIEVHSPGNLFAVVHISGRQFKISPNDLIVINRIVADVGEQIFLEKVLLVGSENFTILGRPLLSKDRVRVRATVIEHSRAAKVVVFKKKRRKNYKRTKGHRQDITTLRINSIELQPHLE